MTAKKSKPDNLSANGKNKNLVFVIVVAAFLLVFGAVIYLSTRSDNTGYQPIEEANAKKDIVSSTESSRPVPVLEGYGFDVGSMWVYETLDATLTIKVVDKYKENGNDVYVYDFYYGSEKVAEEHRVYNKDYIAKIKSIQGDSTVTVYQKPLILYRFPLKKGLKWKNEFDIDGVTYISEVEVVSYEKVTTKGGVFMAYKIKHKTYPKGDPKNAIIDADWYNPKIGLIAYAKEGGQNPKALFKYNVKLIDIP